MTLWPKPQFFVLPKFFFLLSFFSWEPMYLLWRMEVNNESFKIRFSRKNCSISYYYSCLNELAFDSIRTDSSEILGSQKKKKASKCLTICRTSIDNNWKTPQIVCNTPSPSSFGFWHSIRSLRLSSSISGRCKCQNGY